MSKFIEKAGDVIAVGSALGCGTCLTVLIIIIGVIKGCVSEDPDPMDNSINKSQELVELLEVVDSTGNGFRVHYATSYAVTTERYDEICSRQKLKDAFKRIKQEAPQYFGGSLLETDIYDFAAYVKKRDTLPDVHIDCIFVTGPQKEAFYAQPNPNLPDGETRIDPRTEQGLQWIKRYDIYTCMDKGKRIYRYWKCPGIREISSTDERFTHYREAEKVY